MNISKKSVIQGVLFSAPIVLSSALNISPVRAASLAFSTASLTLENFNRPGTVNPSFPAADTVTLTSTDATDGTVIAKANASAIATTPPNPTRISQSSDASVEQFGRRFSGFALGGSFSNLDFDTEDGLFRFDFVASLSAIRSLTAPESTAIALVGFQILDTADNEIDFFEASQTAGNLFTIRNSSFVTIAETSNTASLSGFYARQFAAGTQLRVRGITFTGAATAATVPEPSMFAALLILPGLMGLKKVVKSCDRQFD